ncbi:MAG: hypothetical protein LBJ19_02030 [Holosporaceae bacterium]|jgi:DNA polymerase-1|nr:hypothetical protein [Holosporaceae bacterium]
MKKKLAVLVDGSGLIFRAYFALQKQQLNSRDGQPIGAIVGFCTMLISILRKHLADFFAVVLDSGGKTFRSRLFPSYKSNRKQLPDDLRAQFPFMADACQVLGVPLVKKPEYEADDLIATYASLLSSRGYVVRIISSDKDFMQLITGDVHIFDPLKSKTISADEVLEKYSVYPSQMVSFQALTGDTCDNIPGVDGIGPVMAAKLINKYASLDGIYENIGEVQPERIKNKLLEQKELAELSFKLARLDREVDVDDNFENFRPLYGHHIKADPIHLANEILNKRNSCD